MKTPDHPGNKGGGIMITKNIARAGKALLLAGASGLVAASAAAQSAQTAQTAQTSALAIEEIIITAEKRESTLQDTPISISAISGDALAQSSIYDTETLSYSVPGLTIQRDVVGKAVIRGVGTENFTVGGDPGVATYVDGAYIARSSVAIFDFFDVERIEVLRGPQGTLYGRNATGGVINVISKAPTSAFEGYVRAGYGNFDSFRAEGAISGPITTQVRARIAGFVANRDGFTKNIFPGAKERGLGELDTKDLWALRGRIDVDFTDSLTLELIGDIYRDDSNPPAFFYTDDTLPWQTPTSIFPRDPRVVAQGFEFDAPGFANLQANTAGRWDQTGVTARLRWRGEAVTVTSISAYRDIEFEWLNDGDGLSDFVVTYFQQDFSEQFTQEIQIASVGDGRLQWIVGGFYLNEDANGIYAVPVPPITVLFEGANQTDAFGIFAEASYQLGDFGITAGIRYNDEKKKGDFAFSLFDNDPNGFTQQEKASFSAFTPRFVLDYKLENGTLVYASATRGFKSGGFSFLDVPLNAFDEEFIWAYETGVKARLAQDRVQANAAFFYYNYKDQQLSQVTMLATRTTNAGSSTIWGVELELSALVTERLRLDGNIAYLNTKFDEFCTEDTRNPSLPIDVANCGTTPNLKGNELPRSPDFTANAALTYSFPVGEIGTAFVRGEWQFTGDQFFSVFNRDSVAQEGVSLFNASAGFENSDGHWTARVWVRNLTDKTYFSNLFESGVINTLVIPQGFVAPPRTYGGTLTFRF